VAPHADIRVRLTPRAARDEISAGREPGSYAVRVTAPPVDGRANDASRVSVVRGQKARDKVVRVEGLDVVALRERLAR
jgi:uncharacterized protein YggU (UPF0235/DUF167 family)